MKRKAASKIMMTLLFLSVVAFAFKTQAVRADGSIYIRADGSIDPITAPIQRYNDLYRLTGDITGDGDGIVVERDNMTLDGAGHTVQGTGGYDYRGIDLSKRSNVTIKNIQIKTFWCGIKLDSSSNNTISGSEITENSAYAILFHSSSNNSITSNNISNNKYNCIWLDQSSNNMFRANLMASNRYSFHVDGWMLSDFINDIDTSNTVDGKPVYYLVSQQNLTINPSNFSEVGYLALINSTKITVEDLTLTNNSQGILLAHTTNTSITRNNIRANNYGAWLVESSHNRIVENSLSNNQYGTTIFRNSNNNYVGDNNITGNSDAGVHVSSSSNSVIENSITANKRFGILMDYALHSDIARNNITDAEEGIRLYRTSSNTVTENNIANNNCGILIDSSSDYSIYHNDFVNNGVQVSASESVGVWDNGYPSGGNYWSDYVGEDGDDDGIGDTPYVIDADNQDSYPLTEPWSPPTMAKTLIRTVKFWSLQKGTENSLAAKLEGALRHLDTGKKSGAVHKLMAFVSQVEALEGKKLGDEQANYLISEAQKIIDLTTE